MTDDAGRAGEFNAWVFCRRVLLDGAVAERTMIGEPYERFSAALDAHARKLADELKPHLIAAADVARLTAERDALATALAPFAAVRLPDSWPAKCVVDWREGVGNDGHRFASASYLGIDAQGGPTVADYRAAALAGRAGGGGE